jgi:hypothetical protein
VIRKINLDRNISADIVSCVAETIEEMNDELIIKGLELKYSDLTPLLNESFDYFAFIILCYWLYEGSRVDVQRVSFKS